MKENGKMFVGFNIENRSSMLVLTGMRRVLMVRSMRTLARLQATATATTTATTTASATAYYKKPSYSQGNGGRRDIGFRPFGKILLSATLVAGAKGSAL